MDMGKEILHAISELSDQFKVLDKRLTNVEQRLDKVDQRLDKVDHRLEKIEGSMDIHVDDNHQNRADIRTLQHQIAK